MPCCPHLAFRSSDPSRSREARSLKNGSARGHSEMPYPTLSRAVAKLNWNTDESRGANRTRRLLRLVAHSASPKQDLLQTLVRHARSETRARSLFRKPAYSPMRPRRRVHGICSHAGSRLPTDTHRNDTSSISNAAGKLFAHTSQRGRRKPACDSIRAAGRTARAPGVQNKRAVKPSACKLIAMRSGYAIGR